MMSILFFIDLFKFNFHCGNFLIFPVPPTINESSSSPPLQTVIPGTGFAVECNVQAVPEAQVQILEKQ